MKKFLVLIFILIILNGGNCNLTKDKIKKGEVIINGQTIKVEVVHEIKQLQKGLSNRKNLAENSGMLFVFQKPDIYEFWMKDMKFPLDIIWIKGIKEQKNFIIGEIVEIWENASVPKTKNEIPSYRPKNVANFVLEVEAKTVKKFGWKVKDRVEIKFDL
jgi:uncharacterized membrane protein (UPF0127 family)